MATSTENELTLDDLLGSDIVRLRMACDDYHPDRVRNVIWYTSVKIGDRLIIYPEDGHDAENTSGADPAHDRS